MAISENIKSLFKQNVPKKCRLTFFTDDGNVVVRENKILSGSFTIDRASCSGEHLEIGTAIASQFSARLRNLDDEFSNIKFEGKEVFVEIGVEDNEKINWIPNGMYIIDTPPRKLSSISIQAMDRMIKFDTTNGIEDIRFPISSHDLIEMACDKCNVVSAVVINSLPNIVFSNIQETYTEVTWRNILQSVCMAIGVNAYMDEYGHLDFGWYQDKGDIITPHERYYGGDLYENPITITGVQATIGETVYTKGTDDYSIDISDCLLLDDNNVQNILNIVGDKLIGFSYVPYEITTKSMPYIKPMDIVTLEYSYKDVVTIVTNTLVQLNGAMTIVAKGETDEYNSVGSKTLSTVQSKVIEALENKVINYTDGKTNAVDDLNKLVSSGLGLNRVELDGKAYLCDGTTLSDSTIIYTINSNGFAWTNDWNNGSPVWNYGVTKDGNAILNYLTVNKLSADQIDVENLFTSKFKAHSEGEGWTSDISMNDNSFLNVGFAMQNVVERIFNGIKRKAYTRLYTMQDKFNIEQITYDGDDEEERGGYQNGMVIAPNLISLYTNSGTRSSSITMRDNELNFSSKSISFSNQVGIPWKNITNECIFPDNVLDGKPTVMFDGHQVIVSFGNLFATNGNVTKLMELPSKYKIVANTRGVVTLGGAVKDLTAISGSNTIELISATSVTTSQRIRGQIVVPINYVEES